MSIIRGRDMAALAEKAAKSGYSALRLRHAEKAYGTGPAAVRALRGVDLEVWRGQFVVLFGPSGSGKTTLLNLLGAIEEPTGGEIQVAGMDVGNLRGEDRTSYRCDSVPDIQHFARGMAETLRCLGATTASVSRATA